MTIYSAFMNGLRTQNGARRIHARARVHEDQDDLWLGQPCNKAQPQMSSGSDRVAARQDSLRSGA